MSRLLVFAACCAGLTACSAGTAPPSQTPLKFSSTRGGVATTVVETHVPARVTFDQFARNEPKMIRRALHAQRVRVTRTQVGGRRALDVSYLLPRKRVRQTFVRSGELMYVVTYTSSRR